MKTDKKANFIRIAEARTNKIIATIGLLGNLASSSYYEYTPEQVESIFTAIQTELDAQKQRFNGRRRKKQKFSL